MKKTINVLSKEERDEIIHLFTTLNNNSTPFIADLTGHKEWLVDEYLSQYLKMLPKAIINEPEDIEGSLFELSEEEMIARSSDEIIVQRYNTNCNSAPDFRKRLMNR